MGIKITKCDSDTSTQMTHPTSNGSESTNQGNAGDQHHRVHALGGPQPYPNPQNSLVNRQISRHEISPPIKQTVAVIAGVATMIFCIPETIGLFLLGGALLLKNLK